MTRKFYKRIEDVPPEIAQAYRDGDYSFDPRWLGPQAHTHWSTVDWINYVSFRPELEKLRAAEPQE